MLQCDRVALISVLQCDRVLHSLVCCIVTECRTHELSDESLTLCNTLQHAATHCNNSSFSLVWHFLACAFYTDHSATYCNTSATRCNTLQHTFQNVQARLHCNSMLCHTATHCNRPQHTAISCNTATHFKNHSRTSS